MAAGMLAFALGVMLLHSFSRLPTVPALLALGLISIALLRRRQLRVLAAFGLGLLWAAVHAQLALQHRLGHELEGVDLEVTGEIVDLPVQEAGYVRFLLRPDRLGGLPAHRTPRLLKLGWYGRPPPLLPGEVWQLRVRLKRPHGLLNPGGFDYERWLFANRIDATGYVREPQSAQRMEDTVTVDRARAAIAAAIAPHVRDFASAGIVSALVVGDRRGITAAQWEVFSGTGTSHLVAISGLHVGLLALLMYRLATLLWRLFPRLCLAVPAPLAGAVAGALAALVYAALAGFSLPTQRALVMLAVPALALLARRRLRLWHGWTLALAAVLLWDPFAPLGAGFWLSFGAVAVLLGLAAEKGGGRVEAWLRPQLAVALALLPLTALWFAQAPWLSPLANLLAIPLVSFVGVPLALAGAALLPLWAPGGALLLKFAAAKLDFLLLVLEWIASFDPGVMLPQLPAWALVMGLLASLLLVLPRGLLSRWLVVPLLLPFALYRPAAADEERARVTLLDVGQGLAVVVEVGERVLVYDAGPAFGGIDAGATVLVPFLRSRGVRRIDRLIISHADNDHSGGVSALLSAFPVREVLAGEPLPQTELERPCRAGQRWHWGGVEMRVLWPTAAGTGNNASCVLAIEVGPQRLLLFGDIEARAERALLALGTQSLRASALIVPHHGSRSSSSAELVELMRPRFALVSAGYRNRWGFPRPEVVARYQAQGGRVLRTFGTGAMSFELTAAGIENFQSYRASNARYYHAEPEL
jgi:competence protein ComEC